MVNLREEIVRHYRWLRQYGFNDSHSGNASAREGSRIWITPTGACGDLLETEALVACTPDGGCGDGASFDAPLHLEVYRRNPQIQALLHGHAPYTVAMTLDGQEFVPSDFEGLLYFPRVPVIDIPTDKYMEEAPKQVARILTHHPIAVVRGHGAYACAATVNLAYKWICSLEMSAKTAFIARQAGTLPR